MSKPEQKIPFVKIRISNNFSQDFNQDKGVKYINVEVFLPDNTHHAILAKVYYEYFAEFSSQDKTPLSSEIKNIIQTDEFAQYFLYVYKKMEEIFDNIEDWYRFFYFDVFYHEFFTGVCVERRIKEAKGIIHKEKYIVNYRLISPLVTNYKDIHCIIESNFALGAYRESEKFHPLLLIFKKLYPQLDLELLQGESGNSLPSHTLRNMLTGVTAWCFSIEKGTESLGKDIRYVQASYFHDAFAPIISKSPLSSR